MAVLAVVVVVVLVLIQSPGVDRHALPKQLSHKCCKFVATRAHCANVVLRAKRG